MTAEKERLAYCATGRRVIRCRTVWVFLLALERTGNCGQTDSFLCRLKSGNACCYSGQNISSSSSIFKNIQIKIYRIIIVTIFLYGCDTWSLTFREERRLRVFENRVLRGIFGAKGDEVTGE